ncbi:polysaccharide export outer membrane protein [Paraburkholderia phenazinium]|uniref:Polysaccharide export outer membrane protein n=2 Tax=Paraburkholderia phenazinium TaxID=60549 RepID=A0A1G8A0R8_9BURK|nr:polysaccharide export outer membrane protein [Paraburkholderia phenazinium]
MCRITKAVYRAVLVHTAVQRARVLGMMAAFAVLTACSVVPGQRMVQPPTLPVSNTDDGKATGAEQIPITDITLATVQQEQQTMVSGDGNDLAPLFAESGPYKIGPGDVLQITVWDHPELAAAQGQPVAPTRPSDAALGFLVDHEGNLQFPYVGTLHVAGDSAEQVQRKITADLGKVMVKPQVTVRVASYRASQIYIDGEVRAPGSQSINDIPMTLTEAINRAGGFAPSADQGHVVIVRGDKTYYVNVAQMLHNNQNPSRIVLQNGDLLRIEAREDYGVYVMGEVNKPATVLPMKNGKLSLGEAISQAGSLNNTTADAKELYVIRGGPGLKPQVWHLDATSPVSMLLANQFELQPKDVVYVDAGGLVRFNRVLNLLLPLVNAGLTAAIVTK